METRERDRVYLEHFISKKKSNLPGNPDYLPSVYPEVTVEKKCSSGNSNFNTNANSLVNQALFAFIWMGKRVWCNSIALFILLDPQILEMLIGVNGVERLDNKV